MLKWEEIKDNMGHGALFRARVPWGWLVREEQDVFHLTMDRSWGWDWRTSLTFVFDPFHWWRV